MSGFIIGLVIGGVAGSVLTYFGMRNSPKTVDRINRTVDEAKR